MIDDLIYDLQCHVIDEHEKTNFITDPLRLSAALGIPYRHGALNVASSNPEDPFVIVSPTGNPEQDFEDGMHEVSHGLQTKSGFEAAIEYFHSSVPDMTGHKEQLVRYTSRLMMIPKPIFDPIIEQYGMTPEAIWRLHRASKAPLEAAGQRLIETQLDKPCAFFLATGETITFVAKGNCFTHFWVNSPVYAASNQFGAGLKMFLIPGTRTRWIGLCMPQEAD